jgi:hypothetical protein
MGSVIKNPIKHAISSLKDPLGTIGKDMSTLMGKDPNASANAAAQAQAEAEAQRAQFQAQTDALNAAQQLASQNQTDNVVQVETGTNSTTGITDNPLARKKRPASLSSSLGL